MIESAYLKLYLFCKIFFNVQRKHKYEKEIRKKDALFYFDSLMLVGDDSFMSFLGLTWKNYSDVDKKMSKRATNIAESKN